MSEMLERVARAMKKFASEPLGNLTSLEPVLVGNLGDGWRYLARASLMELRNPSAEMLEAGYDPFSGEPPKPMDDSDREYLTEIFQAMIDEALRNPTDKTQT